MDVTDANPYGTPPRKTTSPAMPEIDVSEPPAPVSPPANPWRSEQPDPRRLLQSPAVPVDRIIDVNGQVPAREVMSIANHIMDASPWSVTAQANIDARNALAVLLPGGGPSYN